MLRLPPLIKDLPKAEREKITTRLFNYNYEKVFAATVKVLDDNDFTIDNMDLNTGLTRKRGVMLY